MGSRLWMVLRVGCPCGCLGHAAMKIATLIFTFIPVLALAGPDYWESENGRIVPDGSKSAVVADCMTYEEFGHATWLNNLALNCTTSGHRLLDRYHGKYGEIPADPEVCLDAKPVTSSTNAQTACYNQFH